MNKQDYIQLISSLVIYYKVQHAILKDSNGNKERDAFIKVWRRIKSRAIKAGVSPKCFSTIDSRAHAIAYSWYSDSFEDYITHKHAA